MIHLVQITFNQAFDPSGRGNSAHQYKVFIKAEDNTKKNKKSDIWTVPNAQETHKDESNDHAYSVASSPGLYPAFNVACRKATLKAGWRSGDEATCTHIQGKEHFYISCPPAPPPPPPPPHGPIPNTHVVRTLSYWCFSPGYVMTDLLAQGVRSIILTFGTLSPLDSFTSELRMYVHLKKCIHPCTSSGGVTVHFCL